MFQLLRILLNWISSFFWEVLEQSGEYKEAVSRRCSVKKVFLKISQNSKENTCHAISFVTQLQASGLQLYQKKLRDKYFPVSFEKFLRTLFLKNTTVGSIRLKTYQDTNCYKKESYAMDVPKLNKMFSIYFMEKIYFCKFSKICLSGLLKSKVEMCWFKIWKKERWNISHKKYQILTRLCLFDWQIVSIQIHCNDLHWKTCAEADLGLLQQPRLSALW